MLLRTAIVQLLQDMRTHKLRSLLTVFGITWGTVGVMLLLALGEGIRVRMQVRHHGLGDGIVIVWPGRTTRPFGGYGAGRPLRWSVDDILRLPAEIPELEAVGPEYFWHTRVSYGPVARNLRISGVYPAHCRLRHLYPRAGGRFIEAPDIDARRRVAFIGNRVRLELFDQEDPVGKYVMIRQTPFRVIGCLTVKEQNSSYGSNDEWQVFIPATTFATFFGQENPDLFVYRAVRPGEHTTATRKVYEALGRRYQFDPDDAAALNLWDTSEVNRFLFYFFVSLNVFMGVGGGFTLLVGGIGVANIMYIVVRERTPEIGLKMAVGARPRQIMAHFLLQAALLTVVGGGVGILVSWGVAEALSATPLSDELGEPKIAPWVAAITVGLLGLVGGLAGYFPARRAARMDPIQALGY